MARARVELKEGLSLESRGRTFKKGQPVLLTNPDEIQFYSSHPQFMVTMLEEEKKPVKEAPKVSFKVGAGEKPALPQVPPAPPIKEEDEERSEPETKPAPAKKVPVKKTPFGRKK